MSAHSRVRGCALVVCAYFCAFSAHAHETSKKQVPESESAKQLPRLLENAPSTRCTADSCGKFNTAIDWVFPPEEAARRAAKEKKLLLVLHLSGNLAKEQFT